jgi:hypothetical protein
MEKIWLIGNLQQDFPDRLFLTNQDVLKTLFYHHNVMRQPFPIVYKTLAEKMKIKWANNSTVTFQRIKQKMACLVKKYETVRKHKKDRGQIEKLSFFLDELQKNFDITPQTTVKPNKNQLFELDNLNAELPEVVELYV